MKTYNIILISVLSLVFLSCSNDNSDTNIDFTSNDLMNLIENDSNLSIFEEAINITSLTSFFRSLEDNTVLIPTNDAFNEYFMDNDFSGLNEVPNLKSIVLNHVFDFTLSADNFLESNNYFSFAEVPDPYNQRLQVYVENGETTTFNRSASFIETNIQATNGILHKIDGVITPLSIKDVLFISPDFSEGFSIFKEAISREEIETSFSNIISNTPEEASSLITFFVPTDQAFQQFLTNTGYSTIQDVPATDLDQILRMHVIKEFKQIYLTEDSTVLTIDNKELNLITDNNGTRIIDSENREVTVLNSIGDRRANVITGTGIIQVVTDKIILP